MQEFNVVTTRRLEVKKISIKKTFKKVAMTPEVIIWDVNIIIIIIIMFINYNVKYYIIMHQR